MSRAYQTSRARRVTQPLTIIRPRDPAIRPLGFNSFRLFRVPGRTDFVAMAFGDRTNAMATFARRAR